MDSKLIKFDYTHLRNEAHVAYHESVTVLFGVYTPASLNITPQRNAYYTVYRNEISILDVIRHSQLTAEIEEQDHRRDRLYRGFADTVKGTANHFD